VERPDAWWRNLIAVGILAEDLSPLAIARFAGVDKQTASDAIAFAKDAGVLTSQGIDPSEESGLVADLHPQEIARVHEAVTRRLMAEGPHRLIDAIRHARAATALVPLEELVRLAENAARVSLSISDYASAQTLLEFADEFGERDSPVDRARRLCDLGRAYDGLGQITNARTATARAFELAEFAQDTSLAVRAAVQYAMPVDWYAGDIRATSMLQRAMLMSPSPAEAIQLTAARAVTEMRVPVNSINDQQVAWITRASVAQPLAEEALAASSTSGPEERVLALLAWRTTHRAPNYLATRREYANEALDLAQQLRQPVRQVEAAIMLANDALESGDRPLFDQALSVARWISARDGNPRHICHSLAMASAIAILDGDYDTAEELRLRASDIGQQHGLTSWFTANMILYAQLGLVRDDEEEMRASIIPDDSPILSHPLGRIILAYLHARVGNHREAETSLRRALRAIDPESSLLLIGTKAAEVAVMLNVPDLVDEIIAILAPWPDHVAVDSNAWWINGPVALALARLHARRNEMTQVIHYLDIAEPIARGMDDVRSIQAIEQMRIHISDSGFRPTGIHDTDSATILTSRLTKREIQVLRLIVQGLTNVQIAQTLSFSPSTIRNDTTSIYAKLGVKGRPEAAAMAVDLGLAPSGFQYL
jgi:DNA-binding CsgD family transcriptional regulator/tetratricopeptide (TPR) repeat protein